MFSRYCIKLRAKKNPTQNKKKGKLKWICHILCRNWLVKRFIIGEIERRGRRGKDIWLFPSSVNDLNAQKDEIWLQLNMVNQGEDYIIKRRGSMALSTFSSWNKRYWYFMGRRSPRWMPHKELGLPFGISTLSLLRRQCLLQHFAL